jgi:glyoxylase-like metal-dependent hydrolase (beta-lactamase superfamily II)
MPIMAAMLGRGAFWPTPVEKVRRYGADGADPLPGGLEPVFSPGHTLGHCALHLADRNVLFAGDAFVTLDPYTAKQGPRIVAGAATADSERALASLDALAATEAATVLTGHGPIWRKGVEAAVDLARGRGSS